MRTVRRSALQAAAVLAALLLAAGCGGSDDPARTAPSASASFGPPAAGPHNAADVTFAKDMIPHHEQAVEMADAALEESQDPVVRRLAGAIKDAQAPEIKAMSGWLFGWGEQLSSGGHDMGGASMGGMMSDTEMKELFAAKGAAFDRMWLEMMIRHHEGAVEMARTEVSEGQNAEAKVLAGKIIAAQNAEIAEMTKALKPGS